MEKNNVKKKTSTEVKVYTTPTCHYCKLTKEFLKENKINFKEIDVSSNLKAAQEMVKKTGQMGVPVTFFGEKYITGFDKEGLKRILGLK